MKNNTLDYYEKLGTFDEGQLLEIKQGLEQGLDVTTYTNPEFDWWQMEEIREGLEKGLDVSSYAKLEFDSEQMSEIKHGLEKGLDVSIYAKPEFDRDQMQNLKNLLFYNYPIEIINIVASPDYEVWQMDEIINRYCDGVPFEQISDLTNICFYEENEIKKITAGYIEQEKQIIEENFDDIDEIYEDGAIDFELAINEDSEFSERISDKFVEKLEVYNKSITHPNKLQFHQVIDFLKKDVVHEIENLFTSTTVNVQEFILLYEITNPDKEKSKEEFQQDF